MGVLSNRVTRIDLKPGDHVYSWRFGYSYAHHGIYIGDGNVIHFTRGQGQELGTGTFLDNFLLVSGSSPSHGYSPCAKCGLNVDSNGVLLSCLDCFLCGYPLYRFEYDEKLLVFLAKARGGTCTLATSDPADLVLHRAHYLLEHGFGCYNIFRKNCEDFAMYCKTGLIVLDGNILGISGQAGSFLGAPLAALTSAPVRLLLSEPWTLAAVGATLYCVSRVATDLHIRRDVVKISVEDLVSKLAPRVGAVEESSLLTTNAVAAVAESSLSIINAVAAVAESSLPKTNAVAAVAESSLPKTNAVAAVVTESSLPTTTAVVPVSEASLATTDANDSLRGAIGILDVMSKLARRVVAVSGSALPTTDENDPLPGTNGINSSPKTDAMEILDVASAAKNDVTTEVAAGESSVVQQKHSIDAQAH